MGKRVIEKGTAALFVAAVAAACVLFLLPKDKTMGGVIRIGCGDDISGVLATRICEAAEQRGLGEDFAVQYVFADCCSNAAQWALETGDIDMGFYCSAAAHSLVSALDEYEIYSPAIINSEVLAVRKGEDPAAARKLGMPRGREHLDSIVLRMYPDITEVSRVNRGYLMYALRSGDVDAVIVDVSAVSGLVDEADLYPLSDIDYISYCLVIRKDLKNTRYFKNFLACLDQATEELNLPSAQYQCMGMNEEFWQSTGLRFIGSN